MVYPVPQLLASPLIPLAAAGSVGGVADWPIGLQLAIWLALAALVGTGLGLLRERTSGPRPSVARMRKPARRRPLLHHA